jgi:hypothetical protein
VKLAVLDAETSRLKHGERPRTRFWGLCIDGEGRRRFETTARLWNFLRRYPEPLCLYHHHDFDAVQAIMDGAPLKIRDVRGGRILRSIGPGEHEWRNSYALFPSKLAEILEAAGYAKLALGVEGHRDECRCAACEAQLDARNESDTVNGLEAFKKIAEGFEAAFGVQPLGERYLTAASVAFASAQLHAGKLPRWLENREAYRGGRVEAFQVCACEIDDELPGKLTQRMCRCPPARKNAQSWDISSSYPHAFQDLPEKDTLFYLDVEVDPKERGPCPLFAMGYEKLLFPRGKFRTAVWRSTYERYIAPHGVVKRATPVQKVAADLSWLKGVAELVRQAYQVRLRAKQTNPALAYACKIGLNSIYGRLGMNSVRQVAITSDAVAAGDDVFYRKLDLPGVGKRFLSFLDVKTNPSANYLFASAITDNARGRLYDALRRNPGAIYCDTDSVFLPAGSRFKGNQGGELGEWKFEGEGVLTVRGLKDYVWNGKIKRKGGASHFEWTIRRALTRGEVREVTKRRISVYDKREILPDGNTLPITLYDW